MGGIVEGQARRGDDEGGGTRGFRGADETTALLSHADEAARALHLRLGGSYDDAVEEGGIPGTARLANKRVDAGARAQGRMLMVYLFST